MAFSKKAREGESGLADNYQLYVPKSSGEGDERVGAWFGYPYPKTPTACCLVLNGERMIDNELDDGHLWLSVGAFEPGDEKGTFIIHESGREDRYPNQNSKFGRFLASANDVGLLDVMETRQDPARQVYETRDASIWEDLTLDIHETAVPEKTDPKTGQTFPATRVATIVGFREGRNFTTDGASGSGASSGSAKTSTNGGAVTDDLKEKAVALAKKSEDYMSYLEAANELGIEPGHALADEMFYKGARA